jgi:hypothetical protein
MRAWVIAPVLLGIAAAPAVAADQVATPDTSDRPAAESAPAVETPDPTAPPFGLKWGMPLNQLSALGVKVKATSKTGDLTIVTAEKVPDAYPDTKVVSLLFDRHLGLVKVRWASTDIEDDPTGTQGRSKYSEMKKLVSESRGTPSDETLVVGARLFDQEDEFYQCLGYEGCGVWSALWDQKPSGGVLLSIEGMGTGKGFVQVDYESADWQQAAGQTARQAKAPDQVKSK